MKIVVEKVLNYEIVHFADDTKKIFSKFNKIYFCEQDKTEVIKMPISFLKRVLGLFRISRRLFRLDKMCVLPTNEGLSIFWQNNIYFWEYKNKQLSMVLSTPGSRNPLHNSIAIIDGKELYFGEYGRLDPHGKGVFKSLDGGRSWTEVARFTNIKHIHSCRYDSVTDSIWVFCGDFKNQCWIYLIDRKTNDITVIGDGSQQYRTIDVSFLEKEVIWWMDSPLEDVYQISYNRSLCTVESGPNFPGPVWYKKELSDGYIMISTAQEIGPSHKDKFAHIMVSDDYKKWDDAMLFEHDGWKKRYFKFSTIAFSDGVQNSNCFYMHAEAVKYYDGKVLQCRLIE